MVTDGLVGFLGEKHWSRNLGTQTKSETLLFSYQVCNIVSVGSMVETLL